MSEFNVENIKSFRDEDGNWLDTPGKTDDWCVYLPHQCDMWEISGAYLIGVTHEEAVKSLEVFLEDGQKALESLKARKKYGSYNDDEL